MYSLEQYSFSAYLCYKHYSFRCTPRTRRRCRLIQLHPGALRRFAGRRSSLRRHSEPPARPRGACARAGCSRPRGPASTHHPLQIAPPGIGCGARQKPDLGATNFHQRHAFTGAKPMYKVSHAGELRGPPTASGARRRRRPQERNGRYTLQPPQIAPPRLRVPAAAAELAS